MIRLAVPADFPVLLSIECRAGERLHGHVAYSVFAAHGLTQDELADGVRQRRLWVVEHNDRTVIGYLLGGELDDGFHIRQMDVDPAYGRRGHGRALLRHACTAGRIGGYRQALLTTLRDVRWNAPFYRSEGFAELPAALQGKQMRAVLAHEQALGFPMALRVAMVKPLGD
ncbi:GNAT family N-acetyltransferase [Mycetohabitans sp. B8]|uniref:GNAT family N-acetyltransferase n=1 Tax=Mycetohabitans sp. B8 TaxID=2841845 RepID=UPI001F2196BA|nr:GNAT family N-acetyltransferase [Mycetohabitans sp. B8]